MSDRLKIFPGDPAPRDVDALLRDFFRAELPEPWPAPDLPPVRQTRRAAPWWQSSFRLTLAASVLFALLGYLTLAGLFPGDAPSRALVPTSTIASKPDRQPVELRPVRQTVPEWHVERQKTASGHDAELQILNLPDGRMIIEVIEIPSTTSPR